MSQDNEKRLAAETAAFRYVGNGGFKDGIIGVGTGSTVNFFIDELSQYRERICASSAST
jgi:ribose 5-phosphate isomerase A